MKENLPAKYLKTVSKGSLHLNIFHLFQSRIDHNEYTDTYVDNGATERIIFYNERLNLIDANDVNTTDLRFYDLQSIFKEEITNGLYIDCYIHERRLPNKNHTLYSSLSILYLNFKFGIRINNSIIYFTHTISPSLTKFSNITEFEVKFNKQIEYIKTSIKLLYELNDILNNKPLNKFISAYYNIILPPRHKMSLHTNKNSKITDIDVGGDNNSNIILYSLKFTSIRNILSKTKLLRNKKDIEGSVEYEELFKTTYSKISSSFSNLVKNEDIIVFDKPKLIKSLAARTLKFTNGTLYHVNNNEQSINNVFTLLQLESEENLRQLSVALKIYKLSNT